MSTHFPKDDIKQFARIFQLSAHLGEKIEGSIPIIRIGSHVKPNLSLFDSFFDRALASSDTFLATLSPTPDDLSQARDYLLKYLSKRSHKLAAPHEHLLRSLKSNSTSSTPPSFLVIPPGNFGADIPLFERLATRAIWETLVDAAQIAGAYIKRLDHAELVPAPTEVFTRDGYILVGDTAYFPDEHARIKNLKAKGFDDRDIEDCKKTLSISFLKSSGIKNYLVKDSHFEGGNILVDEKSKTVFMGIGTNEHNSYADRLIATINETQPHAYNLLKIPLVDIARDPRAPVLYHLDLGMSEPLPDGSRFICPDVTNPETYRKIEEILGKNNLIPIHLDEALAMGTNFMLINRAVLMSNALPRISEILKQKGCTPITPSDFSWDCPSVKEPTFEIERGGVHCMFNETPIRNSTHHPT